MGLSKGTLGLKFMNRQAPVAVPSPAAASTPPPPSAAAAAAASTSTPTASKPANTTAPISKGAAATSTDRKLDERTAKRNEWDSSSTGSRTSVVYETSLLSFPLLSTLNQSTNAGPSTSSSMTATYSSMPLTSAMVSGRRSFGGANVEIEKLNDPSSHQAAPEGTADSSKSKTSKRPKKADRDAALVESVRAGKTKSGSGSSSKAGGKRTADLDRRSVVGVGEEEDGANKKKRRKTDELYGVTARWELDVDDDAAPAPSAGRRSASDSDGQRSAAAAAAAAAKSTTKAEFARPAGFDGVKKKQASPAMTGKGKGKGRLMDDEQYQWAKQGETREWDAGKSSQEEDETDSDSSDDDDDDDEEEERMVSSSEEESSEEEVEAILADEQRFSEAADRAARGGRRAGSQSKSRRGQGRR